MNIQLDLIIPPIIVGILILLLFNVYTGMMDSQVSSRIYYDLQGKANSTLIVLQEEFREIHEITVLGSDEIRFISTTRDSVHIYLEEMDLVVKKHRVNTPLIDTVMYPLQLENLSFSTIDTIPGVIRVNVATASRPEHEVGNKPDRFRAFAQKDIHLMNLNP